MMVHYVNTSGSKAERNSKNGLNYCGVTPRQTTVHELGLCRPATLFFKKEDGPWNHLKSCSCYPYITFYWWFL